MKTVGIQFDNDEKIYYYYVEKMDLRKNVTVIVNENGTLKFGKVVTPIKSEEEQTTKALGDVIRISTKQDYQKYTANLKQANQALKKCKELVKKYNLDMKIIDAIYTFDQDQLVFHFYADQRIDFRDLAKELASIYKTRIELRQIGVRDKAKKVCGMGVCGQKLCCSRFLNDFDSVSISMAKNQNLSLNPNKINGVCGRLLCCLKYEDECYKECRKNLPNIGQIIDKDGVKGKVTSLDILGNKYTVSTDNGLVEIDNGSN